MGPAGSPVHGGLNAELTIVLPVYNEGPNITAVLESIDAEIMTSHEILVVYDFEGDDTVPVVRALQERIPQARLHRNDVGRGVLAAMRAGIAAAATPYVLIAMADGSDDMRAVDRMVRLAREGADVVAASRYMPGGDQVGGPRLKVLLSRLAGMTLHLVGGLPIHDPTSNFKLYARRFLAATRIESTAGFELALELSVKAYLDGRQLAEIPTVWRERRLGESRFRLAEWIPHYLRWYLRGMAGRITRRPIRAGDV